MQNAAIKIDPIMKFLCQQPMINRLSSMQRMAGAVSKNKSIRSTVTSIQAHSFHSSFTEASYFPYDKVTVSDDENPASRFGYRVVVSSTPGKRLSSTMTRYSDDDFSEYNPLHHNIVDPQSLDILSSPEVLEILESRRQWDNTLRDGSLSAKSVDTTSAASSSSIVPEQDDEYLSDCEEMDEDWEDVEPSASTCTSWEENADTALESRLM
jgi:hypothetical protein